MRKRHKQRLQMLRQVRSFLRGRPVDPRIEPTLVALEAAIAQIERHAEVQDAHARLSRTRTASAVELARGLRRHVMRPIALVGGALFPPGDADAQAARRALTMPATADYEALIVAAQGMAVVVREHEARFLAAGLPKQTLDRLRTDAEALKQVLTTRGDDRGRRAAAVSGTRAEAKRSAQLVLLLHALVEPTLRGDPALLAEWNSVTRTARSAPPLRDVVPGATDVDGDTSGDAVNQPSVAEVRPAA